ncbi:MAG: hypothetical protein CBC49_011240 [Alphaproteobacteria bacterium TMED89]|nr:hypothetical protein [Rhodospirillaceae bacterium]RPH09930.1 MAG: hypothetical protein CBC49_011240 [Alphaproteobacteria bacterium TMED89]
MKPAVLITGARAPVALHWSRLFHAAGWRVVVADSLCAPLGRFSRTVACFEPLPSPRAEPTAAFARRIDEIVAFHDIALILPTCEEVFHLAAVASSSARPGEEPRDRFWRDKLFAPSLEVLLRLHDKARFNELVTHVAPAFVPEFHRLEDPADVQALPGGDWVLKPCFSRFGTQTLIRPTAPQRAALKPTPQRPWLAQEYIGGEELCCSAVVNEGRVLALQVYRPLVRLRKGAGAGIVFEAVDTARHWAVAPLVQAIAQALPGRGQLAIDLRQDLNGQFKALECNPRSTSGLNFFTSGDGLVRAVTQARETAFRAPAGWLMGERVASVLVGGLPTLGLLPRMRSLSAWPGDSLAWWDQARAFAEVLRLARRHNCSLEAATTLDIQWDEPFAD